MNTGKEAMTGREATAVWCLTKQGRKLGEKIADALTHGDLYCSRKIDNRTGSPFTFERFGETLAENFRNYPRHVFIMATGIVVRMLSSLLEDKTVDPAVVVVDEKGRFAISLLSGHIGGANSLSEIIAGITGGEAVITTATDVNEIASIDGMATGLGLAIENPGAIKKVNMALLTGDEIRIFDPEGRIKESFFPPGGLPVNDLSGLTGDETVGVYVGDLKIRPGPGVLILRPKTLVAGMGCNSNTEMAELKEVLFEVMDAAGVSPKSLRNLATVDIKRQEKGLLDLAEHLSVPIEFFKREMLSEVNVKTPSETVYKHIGVKSVCEAAAILSAKTQTLLVEKKKRGNVTAALARAPYTSLESVPEERIT